MRNMMRMLTVSLRLFWRRKMSNSKHKATLYTPATAGHAEFAELMTD